MSLVFNPVKLRGPIRRLPEITTNAEPPTKKVRINAWVASDISDKLPVIVKPHRFDLPQYGDEIIDSCAFTLRSKSSEVLYIKIIEKPVEVEIDIPRQIAPRKTIKGIVRLNPSYRDGDLFKSVTFELSDENKTRFSIPIEKSQRLPD